MLEVFLLFYFSPVAVARWKFCPGVEEVHEEEGIVQRDVCVFVLWWSLPFQVDQDPLKHLHAVEASLTKMAWRVEMVGHLYFYFVLFCFSGVCVLSADLMMNNNTVS